MNDSLPRPLLPLCIDAWALDTAALRQMEQQLATSLPSGTLMARAGLAGARLLRALWPQARHVAVYCGPGNNGGDGWELAQAWHQHGGQVQVVEPLPGRTGGERERARNRALNAGVPLHDVCVGKVDVVVDALLGIGLKAAPSPALAAAIQAIATQSAPVLALDLPSGLDADSGRDWGALTAAHTLTYLAPKPGLLTGAGRQRCGRLWLASLGAPAPSRGRARCNGAHWQKGWQAWNPRALAAHGVHKGSQGDCWVLGGAPGLQGAARLAARAALQAGAGRVYLVAPDGDPGAPELMQRDTLIPGQTVVAGCGGGLSVEAALPALIEQAAQLVLDAGALNALARTSDGLHRLHARRGRPTVLTPHPLEAARLLGIDTATVQADRLSAAQTLADTALCTVVLKGSGTVIAHPREAPCINTTGHGALASAGTGDVLAGWLGGLMAQAPQAPTPELAAWAVAWHGAAADTLAPGGAPLTASALIQRMRALGERLCAD